MNPRETGLSEASFCETQSKQRKFAEKLAVSPQRVSSIKKKDQRFDFVSERVERCDQNEKDTRSTDR